MTVIVECKTVKYTMIWYIYMFCFEGFLIFLCPKKSLSGVSMPIVEHYAIRNDNGVLVTPLATIA